MRRFLELVELIAARGIPLGYYYLTRSQDGSILEEREMALKIQVRKAEGGVSAAVDTVDGTFSLGWTHLQNFQRLINWEGMFPQKPDHQGVKRQEYWQLQFSVEERDWAVSSRVIGEGDRKSDGPGMPFLLPHAPGLRPGTVTMKSAYCRHCGLFLPLDRMTLDKNAPQENERGLAMLKVFRAIGCTVAQGKGEKSRQVYEQIRQQFPCAPEHQISSDWASSKVDRNTLNRYGAIYYSIIRTGGGVSPRLPRSFDMLCLNSGLNLRPTCWQCRSPRHETRGKVVSDGL